MNTALFKKKKKKKKKGGGGGVCALLQYVSACVQGNSSDPAQAQGKYRRFVSCFSLHTHSETLPRHKNTQFTPLLKTQLKLSEMDVVLTQKEPLLAVAFTT